MAQEVKKAGTNPKAILKLFLGLIVIVVGIGLTVKYFWHLKVVVAGCLGPFLILAGLITVAIAKE